MKLFSSKKNRNKTIILAILIIIIFVIAIYFSMPLFRFISNKEITKNAIYNFGVFGPIILILLISFIMLFGFLPDHPLIILSGYIYGPIFGLLYSVIGITIGGIISFSIARTLGRPFVEKVLYKETIKKFESMFDKDIKVTLFVLFLLPALPNDAFCYLAGLTNLKMRDYIPIILFGRLPGILILTFLGNQFLKFNLITNIGVVFVLIIGSLLILHYKKKIDKIVRKQIKKYKNQK